jgi:hypothetical protein
VHAFQGDWGGVRRGGVCARFRAPCCRRGVHLPAPPLAGDKKARRSHHLPILHFYI